VSLAKFPDDNRPPIGTGRVRPSLRASRRRRAVFT
jgi:hypothetical protein